MMKLILNIFLLPLLLIFVCCDSPSEKTISETDKKTEELLSRMTLEEKVGQMTQINITEILIDSIVKNYDSVTTFVLDTNKLIHFVGKYHIGSFLNGRAVPADIWFNYMNQLQRVNLRYSKNKIPILYGVDHVHGSSYLKEGTIFPHNINIASTFDTSYAYLQGKVTTYETADLGHHWIFAPVMDLGRNKLWGRYYETFGEDPYLTSKMGSAFIRGIQENEDIKPYKAAACAKHFIGYSDPKSGWDRSPAEIPDQVLREFFLPSFKAAIDADVKTIMVNSGEVNGIPVHASHDILTKLLRDELGFQGVVVTDWQDIIALQTMHFVAENEKEATYLAIHAGIDMSMVPKSTSFCEHVIALVKEGRISEERINQSVRRILKLKFDLGLFDNPYPRNDRFARIATPENREKALNAARESIVLMKNTNELLPLKKEIKNILVTGYTANKKVPLCGGWTYRFSAKSDHWFPQDMPTIADAIKNEFTESTVTFAEENDLAKYASTAEVIVVAAGEENAYAETDGSINDLALSERQLKLIEKVLSYKKPVVLILTEGRPRIIHQVYDTCQAVLFAGLPGTMGAQAIAEILSGKVNPSGKMSFSYPYKQGHIIPYNYKRSEYSVIRPVKRELNRHSILEFGEGLSYTAFEYTDLTLNDTLLNENEKLTAKVTVTNKGKYSGKEAVLWFISDEYGSITRPVKELQYFEKHEIKPGGSYTFTFITDPQVHLWYPDKEGRKILEQGYFTIKVGNLSRRFKYVPKAK
ncbi:MAG: glycoside hydrolase family 3 C-terminal domain-containing protein [Cytophagaceae bacterium]|nr:glycoside hydrolase family 3 C-terminal domain-containing protein [Cytophagaceae bacterium]